MDELAELDEGGAVDKVLDVQRRQRYQIRLFLALLGAWRGESEEGMADLLDVDGPAETGFLAIVALDLNAVFLVVDAVGGDGRVVRDLLRHETGDALLVIPVAEEELAEEGVQRLLLRPELLTATAVLLFEGVEEPFHDEEGAFGGVGFLGGRDEEGRVFGPVGGELDEGLCREDEGGRCERGEVAIERCY